MFLPALIETSPLAFSTRSVAQLIVTAPSPATSSVVAPIVTLTLSSLSVTVLPLASTISRRRELDESSRTS